MTQSSSQIPTQGWIRLAWGFVLFCALGGIAIGVVSWLYGFSGIWPSFMACAALGWLFVAAWGPQAVSWTAIARIHRLRTALNSIAGQAEVDPAAEKLRRKLTKAEARKRRSHWGQMAIAFVGAAGSITFWLLAWPVSPQPSGQIWFILFALLAFPFLILSNALAQNPHQGLARRAGFTRFAMIAILITGLVTALQGADLPADIQAGDAPLSTWALRVLAVVQIAVAGEWIVRIAISPFMPVRSAEQMNSSLIVNTLVGHHLGQNTGDGFEEQFGIDLGQSWAVQFFRKASPWLVMGMIVATWSMSAVTTLRVDERGLYQRMGQVSSMVLEPGLHLHLPWPLGSVRRISYGGIREVRLNTDATAPVEPLPPSTTGVEDPTSKLDDRIWSKTHGEELFLMIANQPRLNTGNGERIESQRPYELYHADVVVTYRVGLDAKSSRQATYHLTDADALIAQIGRRELIDLFNSRTAEDLLFADFSEFSNIAHAAVQERLDRLDSGIDILDVIFEAVHPPIKTAETFHRVHGAEKEAGVLFDIARAEAEQISATAQIAAAQIHNQATADALTSTARARAEQETFAAERQAYDMERDVFMFERRLQTIERTFADKNLIVVDPRINAENGLVLDLRESAARGATPPDPLN